MKKVLFSGNIICLVVAINCVASSSTYAQDIAQEFGDFFERCRISVETSLALNTKELHQVRVEERHKRKWGDKTTQSAWSSSGSDFNIVVTSWTAKNKVARKLCQIHIKDENRILNPSEQGLLIRQFLIIQMELVGAGSHEIDRKFSSISPLINAAFLLKKKNPNGCSVINSINLSQDGKFLSAGSAEQAIKPC